MKTLYRLRFMPLVPLPEVMVTLPATLVLVKNEPELIKREMRIK
jgi:hypothetical protein